MPIEVFGGNPTQTAYPSYVKLDISSFSLTLFWPDANVNVPSFDPINEIHYDKVAAAIDVVTVSPNVNTIKFPDARQTSVGKTIIMTNVGAASFNLLASDGSFIIESFATGKSYYIILINTSTAAGTWRVVDLGAGVSQAVANLLAGNGLTAIDSKLNTNVEIVSAEVPPEIDETYRSKLIIWTGGFNNITLPIKGSVPAGFYFSLNNEGDGQISLLPGEDGTLIDKKTSLQVGVGQSLSLNWDGDDWWTFGFGQNQFSVTTVNRMDVSASLNVTLTSLQSSSFVQEYIGELTDDITVFFPISANYWVIKNSTTGDKTLTIQTVGSVGTGYELDQESTVFVYSDGVSLHVTPTSLMSSNGLLTLKINADGTVSLPNDPLALTEGGTGARTQADAALSVLPGPATTGDMLYFDGSEWIRLAVGNDGDRLTLAGGVPTWAAP